MIQENRNVECRQSDEKNGGLSGIKTGGLSSGPGFLGHCGGARRLVSNRVGSTVGSQVTGLSAKILVLVRF